MRKFFAFVLIVLVLTGVVLVGLLPRYAAPVLERTIDGKLRSFGLVSDVRARLAYRWKNGPRLDGHLHIAFPDASWRLKARLDASLRGWTLSAEMPMTPFTQDDPVLRDVLRRVPMPSVSNLTFSGTVALDARADGGYLLSPPRWRVRAPLRDVSAELFAGDRAVRLNGLSLTAAADGISSHADLAPLFVRARALSVDTLALTNLHASIHASTNALLLTEAGAGLCGGQVTLYSLYLDMQSLNAGFTLFADDIDAGEALRNFRGFRGEASGRLHGKIRLRVREGGRAIRLSDAFLYSTPGETGKLRLEDSGDLARNLAYAGLDEATQANVADALTDLDYSALKLTLRRTDGTGATLTTHISGTATRGKLTVPVDLTLNFHGEIEQLINLGLTYSSKMKEKKQ